MRRAILFTLAVIVGLASACSKTITDERLLGEWRGNGKETLLAAGHGDTPTETREFYFETMMKIADGVSLTISSDEMILGDEHYSYRVLEIGDSFCVLEIQDGVKSKDGGHIPRRVDFVPGGMWLSSPSIPTTGKWKFDRVEDNTDRDSDDA